MANNALIGFDVLVKDSNLGVYPIDQQLWHEKLFVVQMELCYDLAGAESRIHSICCCEKSFNTRK